MGRLDNEAQRSNVVVETFRDAGVEADDLLTVSKHLFLRAWSVREHFANGLAILFNEREVFDVAPGLCSTSISCNLLDFETRLDYEVLNHAPVGVGNVELWALHTIG